MPQVEDQRVGAVEDAQLVEPGLPEPVRLEDERGLGRGEEVRDDDEEKHLHEQPAKR